MNPLIENIFFCIKLNVLMFVEEVPFWTKTDFFTTSWSVGMETIGNLKKKDTTFLNLPPDFFCRTSFWQNDQVLFVDIES